MKPARAFGIIIVFGIAFAQESVPLRYTAALDTITQYGGKSETNTGQSFVFATGPDGSSKIPAGLKEDFERQVTRYGLLSGTSNSFFNSSETVHEVLPDASRVVLVESVSQTTGGAQLGAAQRQTAEMTRTHKPDGSIALEDVLVNVEGEFRPGDDEGNERIREAITVAGETNLRLQTLMLEACYKTTAGASMPFVVDPKKVQSAGSDSEPDSLEPVRFGDVRISRLPDGVECRVSLDPQRYAPKQGNIRFISRHTMRFAQDGRLERSEFVSSTRFGPVESSDFEFEGKTYRVRFVYVSKTTGAMDRLR